MEPSIEDIEETVGQEVIALPKTMKSMVYDASGRDLMLWNLATPVPKPGNHELLVRVASTSLNPFDYRVTESTAMFLGFKHKAVGCDIAGQVVAVGTDVEGFNVGDLVYGWGHGLGEYGISEPGRVARVPTGQQVGDYGIYPCVATTAYQLLRKHWLEREDMVIRHMLVIGASGGVGSSVIQIVRAVGGPEIKIYAVASAKNHDYLKSIGVNEVFDYSQPGFNISVVVPSGVMDLIVDLVSGTPEGTDYVESAMVLLKQPSGKYVTLNTLSKLEYLGARFRQLTGIEFHKNYDFFVVNRNHSAGDLIEVGGLVASGKLKIPVEQEIPYEEQRIRQGFAKIKSRHVRGKIKVIVDSYLCQMSR